MIDRESKIEHSIDTYLRQQLFDVRHYPQAPDPSNPQRSFITVLDAYPDNERMNKPLDANYIAIGYSADDGGKLAELGTSAKVRKFTFDFYIFAINRVWGRNLGGILRSSLESDDVIPLLDPTNGNAVIDHLDVDFVSSQQAVTRTPRPWEENAWITRLRVIDNYYDSAGGG